MCAPIVLTLVSGIMAWSGAWAQTLGFPAPATQIGERRETLGSYRLPVGPFRDGTLPTRLVEGAVERLSWRIDSATLTTLEILAPLRDQLAAEGFVTLYECATTDCGGFDFRFAMDVLPEPEMHVDLGDFRYLGATRDNTAISLIVSRSAQAGFVQMTRVGEAALPAPVMPPETGQQTAPPPQVSTPVEPPAVAAPDDLAGKLETGGAVALDDLVFASGASVLTDEDFVSLRELAAYLAANPQRAVAIVGHTDASGSLAANIALSRARARAVRDVLIGRYKVSAAQVQAEGVGYLAPRASNLTEDGRRLNRRVEVMLTSTE